MSALLTFLSVNPHRPPDWRWQLAKYLQEQRLRLTRSYGDVDVSLAKRFATELDAAADEWQQFTVVQKYPALFQAWWTYKATTLKNPRWELEARLLAREPCKDIARKTGFSTSAIEHYSANLLRCCTQACQLHRSRRDR
jgi:hypothetical protein